MFTLVTDRSRYFKVKRGVSAEKIEDVLKTPVQGTLFTGRIIEVRDCAPERYAAEVGDTYKTVALKLGVDERRLMELNGNKPLYPTCKLFVPCK